MQGAVDALIRKVGEQNVNSEVEFGNLTSVIPYIIIKLDLDPTPLESGPENELVFPVDMELTEIDIGKRYALIRCVNGQYLVLCEVKT